MFESHLLYAAFGDRIMTPPKDESMPVKNDTASRVDTCLNRVAYGHNQ